MPEFLIIDMEFGTLPSEADSIMPLEDCVRWQDIALTEVAMAAVEYNRSNWNWSLKGIWSTKIDNGRESNLITHDEGLTIQWQYDEDYLYLWDADQFPNEEDAPNKADAVWMLCHIEGIPEEKALLGMQKFTTKFIDPEHYRVSPWAHNSEADSSMLKAACARSNMALPCNRAWRCSANLFRVLRDAGFHNRYKSNLDTVAEWYGVEIPEADRHTAKGDMLATAGGIIGMLRDLNQGKSPSSQQTLL